jgi:hypothetical protein
MGKSKMRQKKAREMRRMPEPPKKLPVSASLPAKVRAEEEKINLQDKPKEDKDFLHEVNKVSGNMVNGLIMATSADFDRVCVIDPTNRTVPIQYKEKKYKFAKNTLCTTSEYGGVIM